MNKVLITDPIDQSGIDILSQVAQVDQKIGISESDLAAIIQDYDALMIRRPPRSTQGVSSAASDVYKRQLFTIDK